MRMRILWASEWRSTRKSWPLKGEEEEEEEEEEARCWEEAVEVGVATAAEEEEEGGGGGGRGRLRGLTSRRGPTRPSAPLPSFLLSIPTSRRASMVQSCKWKRGASRPMEWVGRWVGWVDTWVGWWVVCLTLQGHLDVPAGHPGDHTDLVPVLLLLLLLLFLVLLLLFFPFLLVLDERQGEV